MSREIQLTQGQVAIIDDEDFQRVSAIEWHVAWHKSRGFKQAYGQAKIGNPRKTVMMHRFILDSSYGDPEIDHRDRNGLNNQKSNLRIASGRQNIANSGPVKGRQLKGVSRTPSKRWIVVAFRKYIGTFDLLEDAIAAYNSAAVRMRGEFAYLNPLP